MRNILYGTLSIMLAVLFVISYLPAEAGAFGRKKKEAQETSSQSLNPPKATNTDEMLKLLVEKVSTNFNQLNMLMSQQRYEEAMTLAKQSLDEARIKTGLDPKSNRKEIIAVTRDTFSKDYDVLGKRLSSFPVYAQNQIMKAIEEHKGGYFLDLLNLLKRTNLVYIQAFHQALKRGSLGLLSQDKEKIRNDINAVRAIPLYLQDPASNTLLLIFDYEVANSDQNYMFNRELKTYLMNQGQDLGYTGESLEQRIDGELEQRIQHLIKSFVTTESKSGHESRKVVNPFATENYKACFKYNWPGQYYNKQSSQVLCLEKYDKINYLNPAFQACFKEAWTGQYYNKQDAASSCEKFGIFN